jgi:hypothetical protein
MRANQLLALTACLFVTSSGPVVAQQSSPGAWLDGPLVQWNSPGMDLPSASAQFAANADSCRPTIRPPETAADRALADRGWYLTSRYEGGWGIILVQAQGGWDGMCRPMDYQVFAFVDGSFAGTISPSEMAARIDGSAVDARLISDGHIAASFVRYADSDPLCCPSMPGQTVAYRVDRTPAGPVLIAEDVFRLGP